jgi:hypothetical protein
MEVDYVRVYQQPNLNDNFENKKTVFHLFPNPTSDKITIEVDENLIGTEALVFNILGQKMSSYILTTTQTIIDVTQYKSGLYLVKLTNDQTAASIKFCKN